ncbi:MAG TPA: hypothetical protein ENI34_08045 [candidate division WOR-3 bacterium]|uniref:Hydrolase n=1 Tax=candidate division WOR-3 bacterium TaxID=2052148 RepID=A0A9C9EMZ3_UNCW3|nr:hypothetical protein [candidate division WOR-3 bacterium]
MSFLILLIFWNINQKYISVRFTDTSPVIDGYIEKTWQKADSAYGFVQYMPYEGTDPGDETKVYLLQDRDNLYVAFRCWTKNYRLTRELGCHEDQVMLFLDPFYSRTTAYYFGVSASGCYWDGLVLDDGRSVDDSWDGVWYCAVKAYDDRYEVEIKIPFCSIRYKENVPGWGINFQRYIAARQEWNYWVEFSQAEGNLVSKYGLLKGILPQVKGYYFELFPEGFVRYDKKSGEASEFTPRASLNLKWDITPQTTLTSTLYPDFAQIESDPFTLNLSRYETYLSERRPFFIEGKEIFRLSDFGKNGQFYSPLNIFYSRRIGKSLADDQPVPIIGGLKLTGRIKKFNYGLLCAYTDSLHYIVNDNPVVEPKRFFGVTRIMMKVLDNSHLGMLFSGVRADFQNYNYALGLDGVYRVGANQLIMQGAVSDQSGKMGWATSTGFRGVVRGFRTMASCEVVQDSFDVQDIGYVPWAGRKKLQLFTGPLKLYKEGALRSLWYGAGFILNQEAGDAENWSKLALFTITSSFRQNWGISSEIKLGPYYEEGFNYVKRAASLSFWRSTLRLHLWLGGNLEYAYNYKNNFLGYQVLSWCGFVYQIIPRVSLEVNSNFWVEWDTTNTIIAVWPMATPMIDLTITPRMSFGIFNEFVLTTPGTDFGKTEFLTNRFGFLFTYNFKPKSWLYIALNDYRTAQNGSLRLQNQVGAVKVKYLVYF